MSQSQSVIETPAFTGFSELRWSKRFQPFFLEPDGRVPDRLDGLELAQNDRDSWVVFVARDALAPHRFRAHVEAQTLERHDVDVFYGDDLAFGEPPSRQYRLKPSFDLAQLVAQDYIATPLIVRGSALHKLGGLRIEMGDACLYDLLLRAQKIGLGVERIPQLLMARPGKRQETSLAARRAALQAWIGSRPLEIAEGLTPTSLQLRRSFETFPPVTLVVPTCQAAAGSAQPFVVQLLDSLAATDWPMDKLSVLIGDDSPHGQIFAGERWPFAVTRVPTPRPADQPFNFAAKMNQLWRLATTEHLVLMNDDVKVRSPGWLKALMTFALDRDVGGVGARLVFPDGTLQHAGVVGGLFGTAAHAWFGSPADLPTYQDWALIQREWSSVTGAVFATRRSVMSEVNGFDERLTLEFNDIDLCLRMRLLGYRIVYTPFAELMHREKASRRDTLPAAEEVALFLNRWRDFLDNDPAYHPALSRDQPCPEPLYTAALNAPEPGSFPASAAS
ncbi:MAG TPA: glycosyltransferase [Phenylobacterium sp.]|uniref:glycosyltransferase family 2 protein n=1 Tax=Phenylobacterium sp. TaxID=1871053 RepID=UPI002B4689DD|nr:glycosyltransferase [Phenylobacterium sp.]HKR87322.1 glycosyltransferase [Phenylobacterium sp.]